MLAIILPPRDTLLSKDDLLRNIGICRQYLNGSEPVQLYARDEDLPFFLEILAPDNIHKFDHFHFANSDTLFFMQGWTSPSFAVDPNGIFQQRVYIQQKDGRIGLRNREMDITEYPHLETHVFNRLAPRTTDGFFYYFPYGYLFRYPGLGPINEFGFRISHDLHHLEKRGEQHKIIAVFGGSAAWGMYATHEEMFSSVLEKLLNEYCSRQKIPYTFSVLNFGMHGHVLLNEILTYVLFCHRLRPDYVIAHDGWNDFAYGLFSDSYLLDECQMTYQYNLENWSQILHATSRFPTNQPVQKLEVINLPTGILKAYTMRKMQFEQIVKANGGEFIWGLQPCVYSKTALSPVEEKATMVDSNNPFAGLYEPVKFLYENLDRFMQLPAGASGLNLHKIFAAFGKDVTLFGDHMHTNPRGDREIAAAYLDFFIKNVIAGITNKKAG